MALAADTTKKCIVSCGRKRTSRVLMTSWHALKLSCLNTFFVADLSHHYYIVCTIRKGRISVQSATILGRLPVIHDFPVVGGG